MNEEKEYKNSNIESSEISQEKLTSVNGGIENIIGGIEIQSGQRVGLVGEKNEPPQNIVFLKVLQKVFGKK